MKRRTIKSCRRRIDKIDSRIIHLLSRRCGQVALIGRIKKEDGGPLVDKNREKDILGRIDELTKDKGTRRYLRRIYEGIFLASYELEMEKEEIERGDRQRN
jgi:chorismate mutase